MAQIGGGILSIENFDAIGNPGCGPRLISRHMSDSPDPSAVSSPDSETEPPSDPAPQRGHRARSPRDRSSLAMGAVAALSIAAIGLSGWTLMRFSSDESDSTPSYSESQRADAKVQICRAFDTVRRGVSRNTSLAVPSGPDNVAASLAVVANARIALYDGGQYLLARLDPATPAELADTVREFANVLMDIGAAATAGTVDTDPDQAARFRSADGANVKLSQLCA